MRIEAHCQGCGYHPQLFRRGDTLICPMDCEMCGARMEILWHGEPPIARAKSWLARLLIRIAGSL